MGFAGGVAGMICKVVRFPMLVRYRVSDGTWAKDRMTEKWFEEESVC